MRTVTGMQGAGGARELAELLRQMGRGQDTMLAHITPEEAEMLLQAGGSGTINPETGLPEFQPRGDYDFDLGGYQDLAPGPQDYGFGYNMPGESGYQPPPLTPEVRGPDRPPPVIDVTAPRREDFEISPFARRLEDIQPYVPPPPRGSLAPPTPAEVQSLQAATGVKQPGMSDRISQTLRESPNLRNLLATGATSLVSLLNAARMRRESRRSADEMRRLGAPIRAEAENLRRQALSGGLTPQQATQQEAQRARMLQAGAQRGVTSGTQQAMIENQLARQRAELGQTNLENALRQLGVANAYDEAAIRAKLAGDRETAAALEDVLNNLIRSYASQGQTQQQPPPVTPGTTRTRQNLTDPYGTDRITPRTEIRRQ